MPLVLFLKHNFRGKKEEVRILKHGVCVILVIISTS